jgi:hypothetical protein
MEDDSRGRGVTNKANNHRHFQYCLTDPGTSDSVQGMGLARRMTLGMGLGCQIELGLQRTARLALFADDAAFNGGGLSPVAATGAGGYHRSFQQGGAFHSTPHLSLQAFACCTSESAIQSLKHYMRSGTRNDCGRKYP